MFHENTSLDKTITEPGDSKNGCIVEVTLKDRDKTEQKHQVNSVSFNFYNTWLPDVTQFTEYIKNNLPHKFQPVKKLICEHTDKKNYRCRFRDLNVFCKIV